MKKIVLKVWSLFPWVWMVLGMLYDIWYQIVPGKWILDSDLASEMVLSDLLNKTHQILSKEWIYSTELRVFESQWFYRIGLLIFPNDWHMARVLAAILMYLVFVLLLVAFSKSVGLGEYSPWLAAILIWPFGRWYLVYALYGTYYLIYMYFSIAVTMVLFRLMKLQSHNSPVKKSSIILLYLVGFFCSLASGLNGVKQMMIYFGPLFMTAVVLLFLTVCENKIESMSELRKKYKAIWMFAINSSLFTVMNAVGCLINLKVLTQLYSFERFNDVTFMDGRKYRLYDIWLDFLLLFGYEMDVPVLSGAGIAGALGLVFAGLLVICLIRLHIRMKELDTVSRIMIILFDVTMIFEAAIYCFMGNYKDYYWLPMLPFAVALMLMELKTEQIPMKSLKKLMLAMLAFMLPILSWGAVKQETTDPHLTTGGYQEVTEYLLDMDLTEGYASFWNSAVLREMSNGKIQTYTLYNVNDSFIKYGWLQEHEKMDVDPEGRCFLLINEDVDGSVENSMLVKFGSGELIYQSGTIYIYEFESPSKIQDAVDEYIKSIS